MKLSKDYETRKQVGKKNKSTCIKMQLRTDRELKMQDQDSSSFSFQNHFKSKHFFDFLQSGFC